MPDADWLDEHLGKAHDAFDIFEKQVYEHGELDRLTKAYIAAATATVLRSEDAVRRHVETAKEEGASDEEIAAALGAAWLTSGSTQIYWMEDGYEELLGKAWYKKHLTEASKAFGEFHEAIFDDAALDGDVMELVALGVSVASRCQHCTEAHAKQAMDKGATEQEVAEAIGIAWAVGAETQLTWTDAFDDLLGS